MKRRSEPKPERTFIPKETVAVRCPAGCTRGKHLRQSIFGSYPEKCDRCRKESTLGFVLVVAYALGNDFFQPL